jgi:hypothetical protein
MEPYPGTEESYKFHLSEARASKWMRNIMGLGIAAITVSVNMSEITPKEHIEITTGGLAFAALGAWTLDRCRREALHDAHIDAALSQNHSTIMGEEPEEWTIGNTGKIFDNPRLYAAE